MIDLASFYIIFILGKKKKKEKKKEKNEFRVWDGYLKVKEEGNLILLYVNLI